MKMRALLSILLGVGVFAVTYGKPYFNSEIACPVENIDNGQSHFAFDGDCEHYIQCKIGIDGVRGEIRPCPFATYWKQEVHSCMDTTAVKCTKDKCAMKASGVIRGDTRNCRGYWECENGKSIPKCCKFGSRFNSSLLNCEGVQENDTMCQDSCFGDDIVISNDTEGTTIDVNPSIQDCHLKPVPLKPGFFFMDVPGHDPVMLPCGVGTMFNASLCRCADTYHRKQKIPPNRKCNPDFHLSFDNKQDRTSYIRDENVIYENGMAIFNGKNSKIDIPRFNNIGGVSKFAIDVIYHSNSSQLAQTQSILSNDCLSMPSLEILENDQEVLFSVGTTGTENLVTTAVQTLDDKKILNYRFTSGYLKGIVNGIPSAVVADGYLRQVQCDLVIGAAKWSKGVKPFDGAIDDIKIYMCDPDTNDIP